jgi:NitT/TauT family transport system ATP-binding protein
VNTTEFCLFARRGSLRATQREDSTWWAWSRVYGRHILHTGAVAIAAWLVTRGQLSDGGMLAVYMLILRALTPIESMLTSWRGLSAAKQAMSRVEALLAQVGLAGFGDKYPWQLSGGMMQRANLCRALIHDPELLLLDEPFGALDQFTREELWAIMQDLWLSKKLTVLLVTHDLREAAYLANRICVMSARPGRILDDSPVDMPRPRTIEMTFQPDFVALNQRLRAMIVGARGGTGIVNHPPGQG